MRLGPDYVDEEEIFSVELTRCDTLAKCTVLVIQLFLTNCVQAHDNCLEVLPHINLYSNNAPTNKICNRAPLA